MRDMSDHHHLINREANTSEPQPTTCQNHSPLRVRRGRQHRPPPPPRQIPRTCTREVRSPNPQCAFACVGGLADLPTPTTTLRSFEHWQRGPITPVLPTNASQRIPTRVEKE